MEEITERPVTTRRRWLVAVAAAVVLIVVGCRGSQDPAPHEPLDEAVVTTGIAPPTTAPATTRPPTTVPAGPIEITMEWVEATEGNPPIDRTLGEPFLTNDGSTQGVAIVAGSDDSPYSLWTSSDGIEWQSTEVPIPSRDGQIEVAPSGYWLFGHDPTALWYSPDLHSGWEAINLDNLAREGPHGRKWEPGIDDVARVGDVTLLMAGYSDDWDWEEILELEPGAYSEIDGDFFENRDGVHVVTVTGVTDSGTVILARLRPGESDEGTSWIDRNTGEEVYFLANDEAQDSSVLFEATPDGLIGIDLPDGTGELVEVFELTDSVRVETVLDQGDDEPSLTFIHQTTDGRTFEPNPPPPVILGPVKVDPTSGYHYVWQLDFQFGGSVTEHWISADGLNWTALDTPIELENPFATGERSVLLGLNGGWLVMKHLSSGVISEAFFSADGQEWHALDRPPTIGVESRWWPFAAWGNRLLIFGEQTNWVATVTIEGG